MRERQDTLSTSALRTPSLRVLLERYTQANTNAGTVWFYNDSTPPRRMFWGGWAGATPDTLEIHTGTYPQTHYRFGRDRSGELSGRGVTTSDAGFNGQFPTFRWAVRLVPMSCTILAR